MSRSLSVCDRCRRHVFDRARCPFCAAGVVALSLLAGAAAVACGRESGATQSAASIGASSENAAAQASTPSTTPQATTVASGADAIGGAPPAAASPGAASRPPPIVRAAPSATSILDDRAKALSSAADHLANRYLVAGPAPSRTDVIVDGPMLPTITSCEPTATSATVPDASAVVAKNKWRFRGCYAKTLARDPSAGGTVTVSVAVNAKGKVTSSSPISGAPASLAACIAGSFYSMSFDPPPSGSGTITVAVTLTAKR